LGARTHAFSIRKEFPEHVPVFAEGGKTRPTPTASNLSDRISGTAMEERTQTSAAVDRKSSFFSGLFEGQSAEKPKEREEMFKGMCC